jgi:hypothetical protein
MTQRRPARDAVLPPVASAVCVCVCAYSQERDAKSSDDYVWSGLVVTLTGCCRLLH